MTTDEFSNEFDVIVASHLQDASQTSDLYKFKFDEYEKSVFLTQAQEGLVIDIYSGKNPQGLSFESSEETRRYLSTLIKTASPLEVKDEAGKLTKQSKVYKLPDDLWFITYEQVILSGDDLGCQDGIVALVQPVLQDHLFKILRNPFRGVNRRRVLRLDNKDKEVEIISDYSISEYTVRYLSKPSPIILLNLPDNLAINGVTTKSECLLSTALHREILNRAVKLALISRSYNIAQK